MLDKFAYCLLFFCCVQVFAEVPAEEWTPEMSRDPEYVIEWKHRVLELQIEAHKGDRRAIQQLEYYGSHGYGQFGDYRSIPGLMRKVDEGDPHAMALLGQIYLHGDGAVEIDVEKGEKLVLAAAEAGVPDAMFELAMLYKNRLLLEKKSRARPDDFAGKIIEATRIDADGNKVAIEDGFEETVRWLEKGRAASNLDAIYALGRLHVRELSNPEKAITYFEEAVARGHKDARLRLGRMLWTGAGTQPDRKRATSLLLDVMAGADFDTQGVIERFFSRTDLPQNEIPLQASDEGDGGSDVSKDAIEVVRNGLEVLQKSGDDEARELRELLLRWRTVKESGGREPVRRTELQPSIPNGRPIE